MLFHLPQVREYVKGNFNQDSSQAGFVSDAQIDLWANEGYMKYAVRLMKAHEGFFEKTADLNIAANTEAIALPSVFSSGIKFLKSTRLERVISGGRVPMQKRSRYTEFKSTLGEGGGDSYVPQFEFRGSNILLDPVPDFTEASGLLLTAQCQPARLTCGNARGGASTTIQLATTADPRDDYYNGERIFIVSGRGEGQFRTITDYVGSTRTATVAAWDTTPDTTSLYSLLIHEDFPEIFHELIPLYATKCAFGKERSRGIIKTFDDTRLKELESDFRSFIEDRTTARKGTVPWHPELEG